MTPKEKAKELVDKYKRHAYTNVFSFRIESNLHNAKQCALIVVNELIVQNGELYLNGLNGTYYLDKNNFLFEVKQEIEKI